VISRSTATLSSTRCGLCELTLLKHGTGLILGSVCWVSPRSYQLPLETSMVLCFFIFIVVNSSPRPVLFQGTSRLPPSLFGNGPPRTFRVLSAVTCRCITLLVLAASLLHVSFWICVSPPYPSAIQRPADSRRSENCCYSSFSLFTMWLLQHFPPVSLLTFPPPPIVH